MVIYKTTNLVNGKQYIGKDTKNSPKYLGSGTILKRAIGKYGKSNFKKEIIEECVSFEQLIEREEYWLNYYDAGKNPNFYNMHNYSSGSPSGEGHPNYNKPLSLEHREKLRQSNIGKRLSNEHKQKLREMNTGSNHPQYGKSKSEETKKKMSEIRKYKSMMGEKSGMYGKNHSIESIEKIKEKRKLQTFSDETRKKMSDSRIGRSHSEEWKKKISDSIKKWHESRKTNLNSEI
jgi:group I intron endonuclease